VNHYKFLRIKLLKVNSHHLQHVTAAVVEHLNTIKPCSIKAYYNCYFDILKHTNDFIKKSLLMELFFLLMELLNVSSVHLVLEHRLNKDALYLFIVVCKIHL